MTGRDFAYWLQGYFEIASAGNEAAPVSLAVPQVDIIKRHLALVFKHEIDPSAGPPEHQAALDKVHVGPALPGNPVPLPDPTIKAQPHRHVGGAHDGKLIRC